jgi:hypothetical protein
VADQVILAMVDEGKEVRRQNVDLVQAGSTPVIHPTHALPSGDRNEAVTLVSLTRWFDSIRVHVYTMWVHYDYWDKRLECVVPSWTVLDVDFQIRSAQDLHALSNLVKDLAKKEQIVVDDWKVLDTNIISEDRYGAA